MRTLKGQESGQNGLKFRRSIALVTRKNRSEGTERSKRAIKTGQAAIIIIDADERSDGTGIAV